MVRIICPGLLLAALWLAAAGCTHFEPKPIDVARAADDFNARTLDTPELRGFIETNLGPVSVWPPTAWSFEQLTLAALFLHPRLDVARAERASVRAAEITAGARPNPTIGVTPEYNFNASSGVSPWIAGLQFDIPIETAGKRGHRITKARQLTEAARLRIDIVAWEIRSGVRTAWLELHDAGQRAELLSRQLAAQQRMLAALETKFSLGAATTGELSPVRLSLARTRRDFADARVRSDEARVRLASAVGVPLKSLPPVAVLGGEPTTDAALPSAEARHRALTSRADLLAALAEYAAAETALKLEVAKQYPDVHLGTGYQWDQGDNKWALDLSAEIPVLHRNQGPVAEAQAKRAEAGVRVLALQARIIGDVDRAVAAWNGAQIRTAALSEVRAEQQARVKSLRLQLQAGATESIDVLAIESELAADELFHWEARAQVLRAFGELEDAIQSPLPLDLSLTPRRSAP
jgi:cobalt-zinc-cadmium efflux system outer membrane protein